MKMNENERESSARPRPPTDRGRPFKPSVPRATGPFDAKPTLRSRGPRDGVCHGRSFRWKSIRCCIPESAEAGQLRTTCMQRGDSVKLFMADRQTLSYLASGEGARIGRRSVGSFLTGSTNVEAIVVAFMMDSNG